MVNLGHRVVTAPTSEGAVVTIPLEATPFEVEGREATKVGGLAYA